MGAPWFKVYPADYLLDSKVDALALEAQGILVRLWCLCARDGSIPNDPGILARRAGVDAKAMRRHWEALLPFFQEEQDGSLFSVRLRKEQEEYQSLIDRRKAGAAATNAKRWGSDSLSDRSATNERVNQRVADVSQSETETEKESPLPPRGAASAAGDAKRPPKPMDPYLQAAVAICRAWPKKRADGTPMRCSPKAVAERLRVICKAEGLPLESLIRACERYLEEIFPEGAEVPNDRFMQAAQFFLGPKNEYWRNYLTTTLEPAS